MKRTKEMRIIDAYSINKHKVDNVCIKELKEYSIGPILYCDLWHMEELHRTQRVIRALSQILCRVIHIQGEIVPDSRKRLAVNVVTGKTVRADNETIFRNIYGFLRPASKIDVKKEYRVDVCGIPARLIRLIRYIDHIQEFSFSECIFLAAQLVMVHDLIIQMEKQKIFDGVRYMLIFQEHDTISNAIIQCAHLHGVKVISPQHSMQMNRQEDFDQLFFDGFSCDYKLLWSEFQKKQYLSAGIEESKLLVVGNTKKIYTEQKKLPSCRNGTFGVVLDCPVNNGARKYNIELICMANRFSETYGYKYCVKLHPVDDQKNYEESIDNKYGELLNTATGMEEYEEMVEFSIAHITGAIVDLIYDGRIVFIYKTKEKYPIETAPIYEFESYEHLAQNFEKWKANKESYLESYREITKKYYTENAEELHKAFFSEIKKECGDCRETEEISKKERISY